MILEPNLLDYPPPPPLRLRDAALFLDLDGTLAPIAARPQDVKPDPRRSSLLGRLNLALGGRLAVVSGRTLDDVDRIVEERVQAVAAVHGLVRRDAAGRLAVSAPHPALEDAKRVLSEVAASARGLIVEDKGLSVTLHYRLAPDQADRVQEVAARLAAETGLVLQRGDMVVELRTPGPHKGDSVNAFMGTSPFEGAIPVFIGDDVTDEDGFAAVRRRRGFGVLVGRNRPTAARFRLPDVDAALDWLEAAR
jgi:trehalose 6-phosphate phosphatase